MTDKNVYSEAEVEAKLSAELPHWFLEMVGFAENTKPVAGNQP